VEIDDRDRDVLGRHRLDCLLAIFHIDDDEAAPGEELSENAPLEGFVLHQEDGRGDRDHDCREESAAGTPTACGAILRLPLEFAQQLGVPLNLGDRLSDRTLLGSRASMAERESPSENPSPTPDLARADRIAALREDWLAGRLDLSIDPGHPGLDRLLQDLRRARLRGVGR
jgi:hypothetical protein